MTIERDRSAALPSQKDGLEQHLLRDIRAVGLPEPVRELHAFWCCEHPKAEHAGPVPITCWACFYAPGTVSSVFCHTFSRDRNWRFDFAWPDQMLAVEVDGGTFSGGRHTRGQGYEGDCEKGNEAILRGWRVMHVTSKQVESGEALEWIERAFGRTGARE